jgi:hypothetical protein
MSESKYIDVMIALTLIGFAVLAFTFLNRGA